MPRSRTAAAATPRRRLRVALALLPALLLTLLVVPPASAATAPPCPTAGGTPVTSQLTNGTVNIGPVARASGTSASACGLLIFDSQGLRTVIPQQNLSFAPFTLQVGLLRVPATVTAASDFGGPVALEASGAVDVTLSGSVVSTASVLGLSCTIGPFSPALTTGTSGALSGTPLTAQPDGSLAGKLVAGNFAVPAVHASRTCPGIVAALVNLITRLPQPAGGSSITFNASLHVG